MVRRLKLSLVVGFLVSVVGGYIWTSTQAQDLPAERAFKNIKVLKGMTARQVLLLMDHYNEALGVSCEYCHEPGALEKADKPEHKLASRDIQMVADIRTRYKIDLDCMSCHHGKPKPVLTASAGSTPATPGTGTPATPPDTKPAAPAGDPGTTGPAAPAAEPPQDVIMKANTPLGNAPFPHGRHMEAVSDCATCHHTGEMNKCSACHLPNRKASAITKITGYDAMHNRTSPRACWGCHLQQKVGPTTCASCHKK